ncbi:progressive ankylosis protein homolog isoform X2 [Lingula anatina]|uniref:Progressive ankylosis protein homolog isoform X2 n=1 Tax=Lingula anatina TaxID=7574 RepID=A0A1S3HPB6_LINAN|nr:progressive ankylosis protein homolog isoform X2 [Lingula anatina]|eukprot:XP_013387875.1 progressive ankylosis protein homolog isoform X2 [Lingula anatina]
MWKYFALIRYLVPLALTNIAPDIAKQVLNRGITATDDVEDTLASFGLAYGIVELMFGSLTEMRNVGLVLLVSRKDRIKGLLTGGVIAMVGFVLLLITGYTVVGTYLIEKLHQVDEHVSEMTKTALVYLSLIPLLEVLAQAHAGMLLQHRHSLLVGVSSLSDVITQFVMIVGLIMTPLKNEDPILIPVLAVYAGFTCRVVINVIGYYCTVEKLMKEEAEVPLTIPKLLHFLWPLWLVQIAHKISRPMISMVAARSAKNSARATETIAVLALTFPLARVFYGWLNNLKAVLPPFSKETKEHRAYSVREITYFSMGCCVFAAMFAFPLAWVPGSAQAMVATLMGVNLTLAGECVIPIQIFTFMGICVTFRAHLTGWLLSKKKTKLLAPSGVVRLVAIIAALFILPLLGVKEAPMGVAALLIGFITEALMVIIGATYVLKTQTYDSVQLASEQQLQLPELYNPRLSGMAVESMESIYIGKGFISPAQDHHQGPSHTDVPNTQELSHTDENHQNGIGVEKPDSNEHTELSVLNA